jgi:hypothetical protein
MVFIEIIQFPFVKFQHAGFQLPEITFKKKQFSGAVLYFITKQYLCVMAVLFLLPVYLLCKLHESR